MHERFPEFQGCRVSRVPGFPGIQVTRSLHTDIDDTYMQLVSKQAKIVQKGVDG